MLINFNINNYEKTTTCITCFPYGPDFKQGIIDTRRDLIDISATIAELLHLNPEHIEGQIMHELFE